MSLTARQLVGIAFENAKRKGKPDWQTMTLAVLKNRILDITNRDFSERSYGAETFMQFVESLPDLLEIDRSAYPPRVTLREGSETPSEKDDLRDLTINIYQDQERRRIRADLWRAVTDYTSGNQYLWDPLTGKARVAIENEQGDYLPSIDREEFESWRADFVARFRQTLNEEQRELLQRWENGQTRIHSLPAVVADSWRTEFRRHVENKLEDWLSGRTRLGDLESGYRSRRDWLAVGEIELLKVVKGVENLDASTAAIITYWVTASEHHVRCDSLANLKSNRNAYPSSDLALSIAHVAARLDSLNIEYPLPLADLTYDLSDDFAQLFELSQRASPRDTLTSAATIVTNSFSQLVRAVESLQRTTAVTAKQPSIAVVKLAHKYVKHALPAERPLLAELDSLLGSVFRKFCESCERHQADEVPARATELRRLISKLRPSYSTDPPYRVWAKVLSPVFDHVQSLIAEGTEASDALSAPELQVGVRELKLDLQDTNRVHQLALPVLNVGHGTAFSVRLDFDATSNMTATEATEPQLPFDLPPGTNQIVTVGLRLKQESTEFTQELTLRCESANGNTYEFVDTLQVGQQKSQPDWEQLARNPPYAINPIAEREALFGRDATLTELQLAVSARTSTFLWGQKRVGKTSVLQVLAAELAQRIDVVCVILRMGELSALHEGQIAHTIASRFLDRLGLAIDLPSEDFFGAGLGRLLPIFERIKEIKPDTKLLLIIDEFDDLDPAFYLGERGRQFVKAIRSLSEVGLTFFFVGSERMDAIYRSHASDLNKWLNTSLDHIQSISDCRALIVKPLQGQIEYSDPAVQKIISYCRGNPFYMHLLCAQIFGRCWQERRTFVTDADVDEATTELLRKLGPTNFAHLWEDNPELDRRAKIAQAAENAAFLVFVSSLGGAYEGIDDVVDAQSTFDLSAAHRIPKNHLQEIESRLVRRHVLERRPDSRGTHVVLPVFLDWLISNAEAELLPIWIDHVSTQITDATSPQAPIVEAVEGPFPISEDDLLAVADRLVYLGRQKDVAEIRRWLRQFDDVTRIEIAFLLLQRLAERGFISQGASTNALATMKDSLDARRQKIGGGAWRIVRNRADNLCITFVDSEMKSGAQTARELAKRMRPSKCAPANDVLAWLTAHADEDPILVVADDFSGTGQTLCKGITKLRQLQPDLLERYGSEGRILCVLQYAFSGALYKLESEHPDVPVLVSSIFGDDLSAFSTDAELFEDDNERKFASEVMLQIGRELAPQMPLGYGDMSALIAFHNTIPNNTLPIFWGSGVVNGRDWIPLFPRSSF